MSEQRGTKTEIVKVRRYKFRNTQRGTNFKIVKSKEFKIKRQSEQGGRNLEILREYSKRYRFQNKIGL